MVDSSYDWVNGFSNNRKKIGKMLKEKLKMIQHLNDLFHSIEPKKNKKKGSWHHQTKGTKS